MEPSLQQGGCVRVTWPGGGAEDVAVPLPLSSVAHLRQAVQQHYGGALEAKAFVLTDTQKDVSTDADLSSLRDGSTLVLAFTHDRTLAAPAREKISFQPHPKTLTMAGDYEYFAAQGRHPFVFALAEFIDNSLRATRRNAPRPREITVSLVTSGSNPATARGLVCVSDNGCGMNKQELNDWAIMNYDMAERGKAPQEPELQRGHQASAGRFLTGDLSFFGVGSKNAAFFMGCGIKLVTKRADELYVHELCLAAEDLEQRYRNQEDVYVEVMTHRNPGDTSTLSSMEQPFSVTRAWVAGEAEGGGAAGGAGDSFTRVVIGDLKPDVLRQIMDDEQGARIGQELAHLYHYYLHGEQGNRTGGSRGAREGRLPNGEPFPDIVLQYQVDARTVWRTRLAEVEDDMETRLLRAQRSELHFSLQVPDKGSVCGVLYYFPYENDHETVPLENPLTSSKPDSSPFKGAAAGRPTQLGVSQLPPAAHRGTQHPARGTQAGGAAARGTQFGAAGAAAEEDEDEEGGLSWQTAPIFHAFWQGRLIPGARIDSLPFIEAVRTKRTAQAKDVLPDEAFRRLRGALFFGPGFRVTRNKLLFRDNLQEVLATAVPGERQQEAKFKQWLQRCHSTLDKSMRFEALADARSQAAVRARLGEDTTAFHRVTDGTRTITKGDVVRINAKPQAVGRVVAFTIAQATREEGCYANGRVHVDLLPAELHGAGAEKQFSLRRVEAVLTDAEHEEHVQQELQKLACSLQLEPMRFATGQTVEFRAGDTIPETTVAVLNGRGGRMVKSACGSERLVVTQRLWRLQDVGALGALADAAEQDEPAAARPAKRQKRCGRGRGKQDENADPGSGKAAGGGGAEQGGEAAGGGEPRLAGAECVLMVENRTPLKESFQFARIADGLQRAGAYVLEYSVAPAAPGQPPLRMLVQLAVAAGAPASLELSGEGKAVAAVKEIALGEVLPRLNVVLQDRYGNPQALQPSATPPKLSIAAMLPAAGGGLEPCTEVQVLWQQEAAADGVVITQLQLVGPPGVSQGLSLLQQTEGLTHPSARQAQARPSQQSLVVAELQLRIGLEDGQGLEPQLLPLRVRAGAPCSLRLLPGSPWDAAEEAAGDGGSVLTLQHGEELPAFCCQAFDAWGNRTAPTPDMGFALLAECGALSPQAQEFDFAASGVATVEGLVAGTSTRGEPSVPCQLSLKHSATNHNTQAAVALAEPQQPLILQLAVLPSALPASIQLGVVGGEVVPTREAAGEDGTSLMACLEGVVAGETVGNLQMRLLDESGGSAQRTKGKIAVSWRNGTKKVDWDGQAIKLPPLKAPESVADASQQWIRFMCSDPPLVVELGLEVRAAPGLPAAWAVCLVDQVTSQNPDELGVVQCGQPFHLEIEALDGFSNRCTGGGDAGIPLPTISLDSEDRPLQYDQQKWEQGWVSQGGEQVYSVRLALSGHPGPVKLTINDTAGAGGAPLMQPDSLALELRAGPAAGLAVEGPATLECGTKAVLPQLRVRVVDAGGNPTTSDSFEVALNSSALAIDGSGRAASVAASGGNKARVKKGVATFKDVRVTADAAGSYALRVQGASRKVAVGDAVLQLVMAPQNIVADVRVVLPPELACGCQAGSCGQLHVAVLTENEVAIPDDIAVSSLTLRVTPPGGGRAEATTYTLAEPEGEEGLLSEQGYFCFPLPDLSAAGTYSAVAEYVERRPELLAGMPKKDATLRSATVQFDVLPGPPVTLSVEAPTLPDKLAVTNGSAPRQRQLLRGAAVQLRDCHGNAASDAGVQVRFRVKSAAQLGASQLPGLDGGTEARETDQRGRAFVGDLFVVEGSGRAAAGTLECELVCEALGLYPSSLHDHELEPDGWALCWRCPLLFSDDAARFAALQQLNAQRSRLVARRGELGERLEAAQRTLEGALREQQKLHKVLASKQRSLAAPAPETLRSAEKRLAQLQRAAAEAETAPEPAARPAKYGNSRSAATGAVDKLLQSGDSGVVGVMAQLATVDDEPLARIASAQYRSLLGVVVVADAPARERCTTLLAAAKFPLPDMMALTHAVPYRGPKSGEVPGLSSAGEQAQALTRAACSGADPPLPMALPHAKAMSQMHEKDAAGVGLAAGAWPKGCLGFLFNLVRPARRGHRAAVLYGLLGGTLVFETLEDAGAYRELLVMKLRSSMGDIITLDGRRITSRGIVSGASFQVPTLERADYCFGSGASGAKGPAAAEAAEQQALLEEYVELLRERGQVDERTAAAQAAADGAEAECQGELGDVEAQLAELDAQLAGGEPGAGASEAAGKAAASGRQRDTASPDPQAAQQEEAADEEGGSRRQQQASGAKPKRRRLGRMQA